MSENISETVRVIARSPGEFPVLIVESSAGKLLATHFEVSYDIGAGKIVEADWVRDNAIGRHSFIPVEPPAEVPIDGLKEYAAGG